MDDLSRILYVEDDEDISKVTQIALESLGGFTLQVCSSGKEALEKAVSFMPDLLLLDAMMPEMNGCETLVALHRLPEISNVPAIFLTAKAQLDEVTEYKSLGAIAVIKKPYDPMTLAEQIKTIWLQNRN